MKKILAIILVMFGFMGIIYPLWIIEPITFKVVILGVISCFFAGYLYMESFL